MVWSHRPRDIAAPIQQAKRNRASHSSSERKARRRHRGARHLPSGISRRPNRAHAFEIKLSRRARENENRLGIAWLRAAAFERHRSRLVPVSGSKSIRSWIRVVRSDAGVAHRLLVSGRVLSVTTPQVKAYRPSSERIVVQASPVLQGFSALRRRAPPKTAGVAPDDMRRRDLALHHDKAGDSETPRRGVPTPPPPWGRRRHRGPGSLIRDRYGCCRCDGPGSAAHHAAMPRAAPHPGYPIRTNLLTNAPL